MKKFLFSFFALFSFFLVSQLFAQEAAFVPASAVSRTDSAGFIVTGDDQLKARPGKLFTQGGNYEAIELPYLVSTPEPIKYPRWALRQGWEGDFIIAVEILKDGRVGRYHVMESTGHKILDKAATEAVLSWKFQPATKNGEAIVECVQIPVTFKIKD